MRPTEAVPPTHPPTSDGPVPRATSGGQAGAPHAPQREQPCRVGLRGSHSRVTAESNREPGLVFCLSN